MGAFCVSTVSGRAVGREERHGRVGRLTPEGLTDARCFVGNLIFSRGTHTWATAWVRSVKMAPVGRLGVGTCGSKPARFIKPYFRKQSDHTIGQARCLLYYHPFDPERTRVERLVPSLARRIGRKDYNSQEG